VNACANVGKPTLAMLVPREMLVRAGRGLVPIPRALELRERVSQLLQDGEAVLRPAEKLNLKQLIRTFTMRTSEGFVQNFRQDLIARVGKEVPGVLLRFVQKPNKDSAPLRDETVNLETGVVGRTTVPEASRGASGELCRADAGGRLFRVQ
jgi:hypothetical protein